MTPGRYTTRLTLLAILALGIAVFLGIMFWLALRAAPGSRPADVAPTPTVQVIVLPTSPTAIAMPTRTPTAEPTEVLPRVTSTQAPTVAPTMTNVPPSATPTPSETRPAVQRG